MSGAAGPRAPVSMRSRRERSRPREVARSDSQWPLSSRRANAAVRPAGPDRGVLSGTRDVTDGERCRLSCPCVWCSCWSWSCRRPCCRDCSCSGDGGGNGSPWSSYRCRSIHGSSCPKRRDCRSSPRSHRTYPRPSQGGCPCCSDRCRCCRFLRQATVLTPRRSPAPPRAVEP